MKKYRPYIALLITAAFYSCSDDQTTTKGSTTIAKTDKLTNAYQFIEPNISVSYDSNFFKITQRYSNTFYGRESYDFSYLGDTAKKAIIHINADHPIEYPTKKQRDSFMLAGLEKIKNLISDTFSIVNFDKQINEINDFSCIGYAGHHKLGNVYATFIGCYSFSDNDNTEVNYISKDNDLKTGYQILTHFLSGIKSYSQKEIEDEEELIKSKYSIKVTPTNTVIENFKYKPKTYIGVVSVNEKLEHKISEVRLAGSIGKEIFSPNENGQVPILSNDSEKGNITKRGELVLLNSFGREVKLPFTFTYVNNGLLE